jgi:hypothetical protein
MPSYDIRQADGSILPKFILASVADRSITVIDDGTLKPGTILLTVKGQIDSSSATLKIGIKILAAQAGSQAQT